MYYELAERALDGPISDKIKEYISQVLFWKVNSASFVVISFLFNSIKLNSVLGDKYLMNFLWGALA